MTQTVFVPGLFGCRMIDSQNRVIWPPGEMTEPLAEESLVQLLGDDTTRFGRIIDRVLLCRIDVYGPVLDMLTAAGRFTPFAYDWRVDIRIAAASFADQLAKLPPDEDIQIVSHSMGGIVTRWLLESGDFAREEWFSRIKLAVFVAVPHLGAPLALFRILGTDTSAGQLIPNWATRSLASDPTHWPSAYQLLPPSGIDCVARPNGTRQDMVEVFGSQLSAVGIRKMQDVYTVLEKFKRPDATRYVLAYGKGSAQTVWGALVDAAGAASEQFGDGDGTVPTWSADPSETINSIKSVFDEVAVFIADHVGIVGNRLFLNQLSTWLGEPVS